MKKTILVYGGLAGLIGMLLMYLNMTLLQKGAFNFDTGEYTGYVTIIISLTLIFFGIRSYRENVGEGYITFGRALGTGLLIALIGSLIYALLWGFVFSRFFPDFCDQYFKFQSDKMAQDHSLTAAQLKEFNDQALVMKDMMKNPAWNTVFAFLEPFPVGVLISFISALILKKKKAT